MFGLFIFFFTILLVLLTAIIYLIYLPFKIYLKKSGKLSDRVSKRINWGFIITPCLIILIAYCFKDYRTPSKDKLEEVSDIKLPKDFVVLKDEYQDMFQDYCILYDIQLTSSSTTELVKNIQQSKFYNPNLIQGNPRKESDYTNINSIKAVWAKSPQGFVFNTLGRLQYSIIFDTTSNTLKYQECYD